LQKGYNYKLKSFLRGELFKMKMHEGISIVIPIFNEDKNIPILADQINVVMSTLNESWECIWVDDQSKDQSWMEIQKLSSPHKGISLGRNSGQSTALMAGIDSSKFPILVTLDGDLQNDPQDIPNLLGLLNQEVDVVCGYRENRQDGFVLRKLPSYIANLIARRLTRIPVRDLGCTLRVFRKSLLKQNRILGEMHRVLVIYFANSGARIIEAPTHHRKRLHGKSNYGINRSFKFLADLLLVKVLKTVSSKPLYFFGSISLMILSLSISLFLLAIGLRLLHIKDFLDTSMIVGSVTLFVGAVTVVCVGLIGEVLVRTLISVDRDFQYSLRDTYNLTEDL
jgi:glycosyltransferase involved in cell wall biosynthesis